MEAWARLRTNFQPSKPINDPEEIGEHSPSLEEYGIITTYIPGVVCVCLVSQACETFVMFFLLLEGRSN